MKQVKKRDPQNFVMAILYANQVKNYLTSKNVQVERDFTARQALLGWMLDNPWLYAFLLQNEISRLDTSPVHSPSTGSPVVVSLPNDLAEQVQKTLAEAIEKLGLPNGFQVDIKEAVVEAIKQFGEENLAKQLEEITKNYLDEKDKVNELTAKVNSLTEQKADWNARVQALEAERNQLDNALHIALEKQARHEHVPPAPPAPKAAWEKLCDDIQRDDVYLSLETGNIVLMGLRLQGTPDSQNFKTGFLNYIGGYFNSPGGAARLSSDKTALKKWSEDLARKEVNICIEDGKVILAGLKLPREQTDSQDFKKGYLEYVGRYFQEQETPQGAGTASSSALPGPPVPSEQNLLETATPDDLTKILGIGPAIKDLLLQHGISTFAQLSEKTVEELTAMLAETNLRLGNTRPVAWIEQAALLASGDREKWLAWKRDYRK